MTRLTPIPLYKFELIVGHHLFPTHWMLRWYPTPSSPLLAIVCVLDSFLTLFLITESPLLSCTSPPDIVFSLPRSSRSPRLSPRNPHLPCTFFSRYLYMAVFFFLFHFHFRCSGVYSVILLASGVLTPCMFHLLW